MLASSFIVGAIWKALFSIGIPSYFAGVIGGVTAIPVWEFLKRIKALEDVARSFKGVEEAFAIQAGREIRIIVRPEDVDENMAVVLARDIANKIEEEMEYPGQIKVTVIRETRAVEYANK